MPRRAGRAASVAGLAAAVVAFVLPVPVTAAVSGPCKPAATASTTLQITSPSSRSRVDLASTPRVDVKGWLRQSGRDPVVRVDVYGDTELLGQANVAAPGSGPARSHQAWTFPTFVPAGSRTLTACAVSVSGAVAGAAVAFEAEAPPPEATVVAPDVVVVQEKDLASILGVTDTTITVSDSMRVFAGQILVASPSEQAPDGLMRRLVQTTRDASGNTTAVTAPAAVTEVLLQANITADTPASVSGARSPEGFSASSADDVALDLVLSASTAVSLEAADKVRVQGRFSGELRGRLEFALKISTHYGWKDTLVELQRFLLKVDGKASYKFEGTLEGRGKLDGEFLKKPFSPIIFLLPTPIGPFPVVITGEKGLKSVFSLSLAGAIRHSGEGAALFTVGVEYRPETGVVNLSSFDVTGSGFGSNSAPSAVVGTYEIGLGPYIKPALYGAPLGEFRWITGRSLKLELPCTMRLAYFAAGQYVLELSLFKKDLLKFSMDLARLDFGVEQSEAFWGCSNEGTPVEGTNPGSDDGANPGSDEGSAPLPPPPPPPATPPQTVDGVTLGSTGWNDQKGEDYSSHPVLSADGQMVAFVSRATNFEPGGAPDEATSTSGSAVYLKNLQTGEIVTVSAGLSADATGGHTKHAGPTMSADAGRIAYVKGSEAYVKDMASGSTICASCALPHPVPDLRKARHPALSGDGHLVAFEWAVYNEDTRLQVPKVFVMDLATRDVQAVSGPEVGKMAVQPAVNASGTLVAFSTGESMDPRDNNGEMEIYVRDLRSGSLTLASASADGTAGSSSSFTPSIAGERVAFESYAQNLHPDDGPADLDIYVKNLATGEVTLASRHDDGTKGYAGMGPVGLAPTLSEDGTQVAFTSTARLHPDAANVGGNAYVRDLRLNRTVLLNKTAAGVAGNGFSALPTLAGGQAAFMAHATNLHPKDTDTTGDIYVKRY